MRHLVIVLFACLFVGCASVPRPLDVRPIAEQTFGPGAQYTVHEVVYGGWLHDKISTYGGSREDDYELWHEIMLVGTDRKLNLVVWGGSSSASRIALLRAFQYPGMKNLPHLQLLFVGDAGDAERIRTALAPTGAKFYFHQR